MSEGVCMKELFEYMGTHISIEEQARAREEFDARFARWKAKMKQMQEDDKAGVGCKADRSGFGAPPVP